MGHLVTRQLTALFGGMSQQPASLRLPSQSELEVNAYSSVVDGVFKRPPFEHVAKISNGSIATAHIHTINRDSTERYEVIVTNGDLKVYDMAGTEQVVAFPVGKDYLNLPSGGTEARESFVAVTVGDYTFLVNKTINTATISSPTSAPSNLMHWYAWGDDPLSNIDDYYITIGATYVNEVQSFSSLPSTPTPSQGQVYKITGHDANSPGRYYVIRNNGVWEETVVTGTARIGFDAATMPHALIRLADGTFKFTEFAWKRRKYGDEISNPAPSFVGSPIRDIFYYKNRLGFLSNENIVFSCAGDYGNLWRNTVTSLLDSDVIDVALSGNRVSTLNYAVPFAHDLMLFADQTQFRMNVDKLLTPSSVSVDVATEFENSAKARPVGLGPYTYFVSEFGNYSRILEYYVDNSNLNTDANDITAHVPRLLPKNIRKLAGSATDGVLFALSSDTPNILYVYKYFWGSQEKIQASWSYWTLPEGPSILSIACLSNYLYALIQRADGVHIERINLQAGATVLNLGYQILLDELSTAISASYDSITNRTTFTLPYFVAPFRRPLFRLVKGASSEDGLPNEQTMALIDPTGYAWNSSTEVSAPGNHTGNEAYCGFKYTFTYTFSEQFAMNGEKAITTGRLQLRTFTLYFSRAAFFRTSVDPYGIGVSSEAIVPSQLADFTGKTVGDAYLLLGSPIYASGKYVFQIYGDSKVAKVSLTNDTHVQATFQSLEWEAMYFNRARAG